MRRCNLCASCQMRNMLNHGLQALADRLTMTDRSFLRKQLRTNNKYLTCLKVISD